MKTDILGVAFDALTLDEAEERADALLRSGAGGYIVTANPEIVLHCREDAAYAADLDLVCISPNAAPPVCKIMDYGKYRFEQAKREKEARKNQKTVEVKEIRLGLSIDVHDFETKGKHAMRFLDEGNKVKVSIRFRGRELGHPEIGLETMRRFAEYCADHGSVEKAAKMEGRNMLMFLAPKSGK